MTPTEGVCLKPCPFCGNDHILKYSVPNTRGNVLYLECAKCHAQGPWGGAVVSPEDRWNSQQLSPQGGEDNDSKKSLEEYRAILQGGLAIPPSSSQADETLEKLLYAIEELIPYLDNLTDYSSTMLEWKPNRLLKEIPQFLAEYKAAAAHVRSRDAEEIARLNKPFSVQMSLGIDGMGYEFVDCEVLNIGHADRILLIATPPEVKTLLSKQERDAERIRELEDCLRRLRPWQSLGSCVQDIDAALAEKKEVKS